MHSPKLPKPKPQYPRRLRRLRALWHSLWLQVGLLLIMLLLCLLLLALVLISYPIQSTLWNSLAGRAKRWITRARNKPQVS